MLSKAAGAVYGVAKNPQVIIVRQSTMIGLEHAIDELTWVIEDWRSHRDSATVKVGSIMMAFGFPKDLNDADDKLKLPRFESLIVNAIEAGLLPICSAGNENEVLQNPRPLMMS